MARGRVNPEDTIVLSEMESNPERFYNNVMKLAKIVLHCHFSYVKDESLQEDLLQQAVMKAWDLCSSGTFDEKRSSLRNYLYTGMRNTMQNFMVKQSRYMCVDELWPSQEFENGEDYDAVEEIEEQEEFKNLIYIDEDIVYNICDKFFFIGNYHNSLIRNLNEMGFIGDLTDLEEQGEPDPLLLEAMTVEYIWRIARKYGY